MSTQESDKKKNDIYSDDLIFSINLITEYSKPKKSGDVTT